MEWGEVRRTRRLIQRVEDLAARPTGGIPVARDGWAETKAAYRRLDNEALDWREGLEVHTRRPRSGCRGRRWGYAARTPRSWISPARLPG